MKQKLLFLLTLLLVLAACVPAASEPAPIVVTPTLALPTQESAAAPVSTATAVIEPSATPTTALSSTPTVTAVFYSANPVLITQGSTNVRMGPGLTYGVSHVLPAGTKAPLLGKNLNSTWWAVPGPGDGFGPHGWVSADVVSVQGDVGSLPFLAAPTLTPTPALLPVMGNNGLPPGGDTCVVVQPGPNDVGPTLLRQGAGQNFPAVAELGFNRWAAIVEAQSGWYRVQDMAGIAGWVHQTEVGFAGRCSAPGSGPDLPLVENPGAPPNHLCLVSRPGQFPPPGIHQGPGRQFALTARLGNWAEVLTSEIGWHQILIGPGQVGWIDGADVELIGSCAAAEPTPTRIQFEPGAISAIVDGALYPPQRDMYLFRAMAGQMAVIEIHSTDGRANFMLSGVNDGQPYKRLEDEQRLWSGQLPLNQDYLLTIAATADAPFTEYSLELIIEPLNTLPMP